MRKRNQPKNRNAPTTEELVEHAFANWKRQKAPPAKPIPGRVAFWVGPLRLEFQDWRLTFVGLSGHCGQVLSK